MRWTALAVLVLTAACRFYGASNDGDSMPDAAPDAWPEVIDCWATLTCRGGSVYSTYGSDSSDDPTCGYGVAYVCDDGCDVEGAGYFDAEANFEPARLCAGAPDLTSGDGCWGDGPCWPTHGVAQPDGTLTQEYLRCDRDLHECVATEPPTVDYWLQPCTTYETLPPDFHGVSRQCLVDQDEAGCAITGATYVCRGDWECPEGATCDDSLPDTATWARAVCRPGPRGAPLSLGC